MKKFLKYKPFDKYVLRVPLLSVEEVSNLSVDKIKELCRLSFVSEAIFIASPELHQEMIKMLNGLYTKKEARLIFTLLKYLLRMGNRCTPFGLFSGSSLGCFSNKSKIEIEEIYNHKRLTRLDMNYLCALAQNIENDKSVRENLLFYKNTSLYRISEKLRYIEYKYEHTFRRHFTVSIDFSDFIDALLTKVKKGAYIFDLAQEIIKLDNEIPINAAIEFIHELIDNQVLISSISPSLTGEDYFNILKSNILEQDIKNILYEVDVILNRVNKKHIGDGFVLYNDLIKAITPLNTDYDKKYLLQTDLKTSCIENTISKNNLDKINSALVFLNKINSTTDNDDLNKFKEAFYDKYEDEEISLALALDVESGIGYPSNAGGTFDISPLIDDLNMSVREVDDNSSYNEIKWDKRDELLNRKILSTISKNEISIEMTDNDIEHFEENWDNLPNTFSASVNFLDDGNLIYFHSVGGATGTYLLGRFCFLDSEIDDFVKEIIQNEEDNDSALYAEIVHLPEKRAGNILHRPHLRKYEIPYLAKSNLPIDNQIHIDDIMISIKNNQIVLRSIKHNKKIIPKMAAAHNYSDKGLPIYHFLCDLQYQGLKSSISFKWGNMYQFHDFLPRVIYKGVILSLAMWLVKENDIKRFSEEKNYLKLWLKEKKVPNKVFLKEFDNELPIDFQHDLSVKMFLSTIKNKTQITLTENLYNHNKPLVKRKGKPFTNELIMAFHKNDK